MGLKVGVVFRSLMGVVIFHSIADFHFKRINPLSYKKFFASTTFGGEASLDINNIMESGNKL